MPKCLIHWIWFVKLLAPCCQCSRRPLLNFQGRLQMRKLLKVFDTSMLCLSCLSRQVLFRVFDHKGSGSHVRSSPLSSFEHVSMRHAYHPPTQKARTQCVVRALVPTLRSVHRMCVMVKGPSCLHRLPRAARSLKHTLVQATLFPL